MSSFKTLSLRADDLLKKYKEKKQIDSVKDYIRYLNSQKKYYDSIPAGIKSSTVESKIVDKLVKKLDDIEIYWQKKPIIPVFRDYEECTNVQPFIAQIAVLEDNTQNLQEQHNNLQATNTDLQRQIAAETALKDQLQVQLNTVVGEKNQLQKQSDDLQADLKKQRDDSTIEKDNLQRQIDTSKNIITDLQNQSNQAIIEKDAVMEKLTTEQANNKLEIEKLRAEITKLEEKIVELDNQIKAQREKIADLESKLKQCKENNDKLTKDLEDCSQKSSLKAQEFQLLSTKKEQLESKIKDLESKLKEYKSDKTEQIKILSAEKDVSVQKIAELQQQINTTDQKLQDSNKKIQTITSELKQETQKTKDLELQLQNALKENESLKQQKTVLEDQLKKEKEKLAECQEALKKCNEKSERLENELQVCNAKLQKETEDHAKFKEEKIVRIEQELLDCQTISTQNALNVAIRDKQIEDLQKKIDEFAQKVDQKEKTIQDQQEVMNSLTKEALAIQEYLMELSENDQYNPISLNQNMQQMIQTLQSPSISKSTTAQSTASNKDQIMDELKKAEEDILVLSVKRELRGNLPSDIVPTTMPAYRKYDLTQQQEMSDYYINYMDVDKFVLGLQLKLITPEQGQDLSTPLSTKRQRTSGGEETNEMSKLIQNLQLISNKITENIPAIIERLKLYNIDKELSEKYLDSIKQEKQNIDKIIRLASQERPIEEVREANHLLALTNTKLVYLQEKIKCIIENQTAQIYKKNMDQNIKSLGDKIADLKKKLSDCVETNDNMTNMVVDEEKANTELKRHLQDIQDECEKMKADCAQEKLKEDSKYLKMETAKRNLEKEYSTAKTRIKHLEDQVRIFNEKSQFDEKYERLLQNFTIQYNTIIESDNSNTQKSAQLKTLFDDMGKAFDKNSVRMIFNDDFRHREKELVNKITLRIKELAEATRTGGFWSWF